MRRKEGGQEIKDKKEGGTSGKEEERKMRKIGSEEYARGKGIYK